MITLDKEDLWLIIDIIERLSNEVGSLDNDEAELRDKIKAIYNETN